MSWFAAGCESCHVVTTTHFLVTESFWRISTAQRIFYNVKRNNSKDMCLLHKNTRIISIFLRNSGYKQNVSDMYPSLLRKSNSNVNRPIKPFNLPTVSHFLQYRPVEHFEVYFRGHSGGPSCWRFNWGHLDLLQRIPNTTPLLVGKKLMFPTDGLDSVIKKALNTMYH